MRRRKTAVLLVLTALLAAGFLLWGNCSLQTTETALVSPALPPAFDGLRIVELADLHGRVFGRGSRRLLAAVRRAEPDLICIDGDLFDEHTDLAMLPPLLRGLCAIAPVYYVTGNHEWRVPGLRGILAQMRACGVTVLQDDWRVLRRGEDALVLAGTDDPCGPAERKTPAELIADIRAEAGEAAFLLLLTHRNDQLPQWSALGVQAVLAGHCHGGVVRLPFVGGLFGTDRRLFPAWDAGLYRQGETALYVSRGLGYTNVHFRLFNRPEVAVIVLRRGSPAINS
ncbi:metallophosphoesterase [Faecousia sp.]|mgnify:FL=1|uniref:metallophosphoesterase n=1 Tax=Faecousia sp. TaxID=2952921 RepID=UPI002A95F6B3|nr:metallophosphoesterase [Candidatus Faecousia sp.]